MQLEPKPYFSLQRQKCIFTHFNSSNHTYHGKDVFQNTFHSLNSLITLIECLEKVAANIFSLENR